MPVHPRDDDIVAAGEVVRDPLGIAALGGEVEFAAQRRAELLDDALRMVAAEFGQVLLDDHRQVLQQPQVGLDRVADAGAADLQDDGAAIGQPGAMGLRQ